MMKGKNTLASFGIAALIAGLAQAQAMHFAQMPWVLFLAWVAYSVRREGKQRIVASWASLLVGAAIGCLVAALSNAAPIENTWALPIILAIAVGTVALADQAPFLNDVPLYYLGMIAFFASGAQPGVSILAEIAVPAFAGLFCGWLSDNLLRFVAANSAVKTR